MTAGSAAPDVTSTIIGAARTGEARLRTRIGDLTRVVRHLERALSTRSDLCCAQGILMVRHDLGRDAAWTLLARTASERGLPMQAVARAVIVGHTA